MVTSLSQSSYFRLPVGNPIDVLMADPFTKTERERTSVFALRFFATRARSNWPIQYTTTANFITACEEHRIQQWPEAMQLMQILAMQQHFRDGVVIDLVQGG